jgi:hypothetical protein
MTLWSIEKITLNAPESENYLLELFPFVLVITNSIDFTSVIIDLSDNVESSSIILIDWCLTPSLTLFQLYRGVSIILKLHYSRNRIYITIPTRDTRFNVFDFSCVKTKIEGLVIKLCNNYLDANIFYSIFIPILCYENKDFPYIF